MKCYTTGPKKLVTRTTTTVVSEPNMVTKRNSAPKRKAEVMVVERTETETIDEVGLSPKIIRPHILITLLMWRGLIDSMYGIQVLS